jgi:hypothetical protein
MWTTGVKIGKTGETTILQRKVLSKISEPEILDGGKN